MRRGGDAKVFWDMKREIVSALHPGPAGDCRLVGQFQKTKEERVAKRLHCLVVLSKIFSTESVLVESAS